MKKLYDTLVEILETKLEVDRDKVRPDTTFGELQFDSLSMVDLAMALQGSLGVQLEQEEIFNCPTVGSVVELLERMGVQAR